MRQWTRYLSFKGRTTALQYWRFQVAAGILGALDLIAGMLIIGVVGPVGAIFLAPWLLLMVATAATCFRRLHDRNRSGWWLLLYALIPGLTVESLSNEALPALLQLVGILFAVTLAIWGTVEIGFLPGTRGTNKYGADPRISESEVFA